MNRELNRQLIMDALSDHLDECKHWHSQEDSRYYQMKEMEFQWDWIIHESFKDEEIAWVCCDHIHCDWRFAFKVTYQFEEVKE